MLFLLLQVTVTEKKSLHDSLYRKNNYVTSLSLELLNKPGIPTGERVFEMMEIRLLNYQLTLKQRQEYSRRIANNSSKMRVAVGIKAV